MSLLLDYLFWITLRALSVIRLWPTPEIPRSKDIEEASKEMYSLCRFQIHKAFFAHRPFPRLVLRDKLFTQATAKTFYSYYWYHGPSAIQALIGLGRATLPLSPIEVLMLDKMLDKLTITVPSDLLCFHMLSQYHNELVNRLEAIHGYSALQVAWFDKQRARDERQNNENR
jgi:hypothetical protein